MYCKLGCIDHHQSRWDLAKTLSWVISAMNYDLAMNYELAYYVFGLNLVYIENHSF